MHIDHDNLILATEGDVEQRVLMPLLVGNLYLEVPPGAVFSKQYLAPAPLDKAAGRTSGYYPDFTVWMRGFPVMVVEAKAPDVSTEVGYRDASLYARHLNQGYPTGQNPCRYLLSTNGKTILAGFWDSGPTFSASVGDLRQGSSALERLREGWGASALEAHALSCLQLSRAGRFFLPYNFAGGPALLRARLPVNSFAAGLSPVLRRYFASSDDANNREVIERAYVSSSEITEYDRILEALLRDRLPARHGSLVEELQPGRHGEQHVEQVIEEFDEARPPGGQLQIIHGDVGSGKSLFIRRYKELMQSGDLSGRTRWSFIDFNYSPVDLSHGEGWVCTTFVESFERENPGIDLTRMDVLRGVFSRNIQRRKPIYEELARSSPGDESSMRARDLAGWHDDPPEFARGLAQYVLGGRREILVAVMDNVDKLDLKGQLNAFQLALWFMQQTRCFVVLQMRGETYERYKDKPPLDVFRTGVTFHVSSPRFTDVVKRRLELSCEFLEAHADSRQTYTVESGVRVTYPASELETFLRGLYHELFDRRRNITRVLEALAGSDVRRALDMFVSIITSGHLSTTAITSTVLGAGAFSITEERILRILMRTGYRFFSNESGFVTNVFWFDPEWQKPDNFLLAEVLYFLARMRKTKGEIGLEGYFTCRHVAEVVQRLGYVPEDALAAMNFLLSRQLIAADHMNFSRVSFDDSVRILASGFMHVRVLAGRMEYLYGVIPSTPISDRGTAERLAALVGTESQRGKATYIEKLEGVEIFALYLASQRESNRTPFSDCEDTGSGYVIRQIHGAIEHYKNVRAGSISGPDPLDL